jgi:hypothetical protein
MRPRRLVLTALFALALALPISLALAQGPNNNEREAKSRINVEDKEGIWVLDFRFKDPRLITVDIPGRGRRLVWYLWYQVINNTKEPRTFIPDFEWVTLDKNTVHHDQILPKAQDAIRKLEDPNGFLDIKNSVTIASQPIPPSKPDAAPIAVTGVALWDDVNPDANRFSIFVSGLSNGWTEVDPPQPGGKPVMRRKTLQLNFKRLGDRYYQSSQEIRFLPPAEWLYRASNLNVTASAPAKPAVTPARKEGSGR